MRDVLNREARRACLTGIGDRGSGSASLKHRAAVYRNAPEGICAAHRHNSDQEPQREGERCECCCRDHDSQSEAQCEACIEPSTKAGLRQKRRWCLGMRICWLRFADHRPIRFRDVRANRTCARSWSAAALVIEGSSKFAIKPGKFSARQRAKSTAQTADSLLDGRGRDTKLPRDFLDGHAFRNELQHLALLCGKPSEFRKSLAMHGHPPWNCVGIIGSGNMITR